MRPSPVQVRTLAEKTGEVERECAEARQHAKEARAAAATMEQQLANATAYAEGEMVRLRAQVETLSVEAQHARARQVRITELEAEQAALQVCTPPHALTLGPSADGPQWEALSSALPAATLPLHSPPLYWS